jgi:dGTPase
MHFPGRLEVFHPDDRRPDQRAPEERDRDRILYTSAFRRLAGVTQVVGSEEGHIFHNRLTHSLKVAQIGRRLAEKMLREQPDEAEALGGISPEVVEAASLAHDLGHPPFGHIAEKELDRLVVDVGGVGDGFEGNAQSYRIVTKLSIRHPNMPGLNLTRATLNAILKYPWLRGARGRQRRKWGAYRTEESEFKWTRKPFQDARKTVEAELMDWADDITYAVHDLEDFYRAGLIPLDRLRKDTEQFVTKWENAGRLDAAVGELASSSNEVARFLRGTFQRWRGDGRRQSTQARDDIVRAFASLIGFIPIDEPYEGTRRQRANLKSFASSLIGRYVFAISLNASGRKAEPRVYVKERAELEVEMLKELTWHYVIDSHSLAQQQHGQRKIVSELFEIFLDAARRQRYRIFPVNTSERLIGLDEVWRGSAAGKNEQIVRIVVDLIAGMTEKQIVKMYHRLTGTSFGSVLDTILV